MYQSSLYSTSLPRGDGGDEEGGLEDFAGGYGMCGGGLGEVETGWRDGLDMEGEKHIKLCRNETTCMSKQTTEI